MPNTAISRHHAIPMVELRINEFGKVPGEETYPDSLVLGVELEVTWNVNAPFIDEGMVSYILRHVGDFAIVTPELSVSSGNEIVTIPGTLDFHRMSWRKFFQSEPHKLFDGIGNSGCGMHVHINRASLTPLQIGKMMCFINDPANAREITAVAGREPNTYCNRELHHNIQKHEVIEEFERISKMTQDDVIKSYAVHTNGTIASRTSSRRGAICFSSRLPTIEVRIFQSDTREKFFFKNLEFVHAMTSYCRDADVNKLGWSDFMSWLAETGRWSDYPKLWLWLQENGFVPAEEQVPVQSVLEFA